MCPHDLAEVLFATKIADGKGKGSSISSETYVVISVDGEGVEAGKRVLELTSPLSLAGMYVHPVLPCECNPLNSHETVRSFSYRPTFPIISSYPPKVATDLIHTLSFQD